MLRLNDDRKDLNNSNTKQKKKSGTTLGSINFIFVPIYAAYGRQESSHILEGDQI